MSNINNKTQNLFVLDTVQDIDNKTAATCSGGRGYFNKNLAEADVILFTGLYGTGRRIGLNAKTGEGLPNLGFKNGLGGRKTGFNDTVSSFAVLRGTWKFFRNEKYKGKSIQIRRRGGIYSFLGPLENEITSAMRIAP